MNFIKHSNFQNDVLLIAVGIVGAFGALSIIFAGVTLGSQKFSYQNVSAVDYKKMQILALVDSKKFLTQAEKEAIERELIGDKIKMFNFDDKEVSKILDALNAN